MGMRAQNLGYYASKQVYGTLIEVGERARVGRKLLVVAAKDVLQGRS